MQMTIRKNNGVMCATSSVEIDGIMYTASTRISKYITKQLLFAEDSGEMIHMEGHWFLKGRQAFSQRAASSMHKGFVSQFKEHSHE